MRLINANSIQLAIASYLSSNAYLNDTPCDILKKVSKWIEEEPTVDAIPVVQFKDCNLFIPYTEAHRKASGFDGDCAFLTGYADCDRECVHEMDFCSKGERMDGEE